MIRGPMQIACINFLPLRIPSQIQDAHTEHHGETRACHSCVAGAAPTASRSEVPRPQRASKDAEKKYNK